MESVGGGFLATKKQSRNFAIMQYLDYWPALESCVSNSGSAFGGISSFCQSLYSLGLFKSVCGIIHDSDLKSDGSLKAPHAHIVVSCNSPTGIDTIANHFQVEPQYVEFVKRSIKSAQLYLVHRNDTSKFQYDASQVVSFGLDYDRLLEDFSGPSFDRKMFASKVESGEIREFNFSDYISMSDYTSNARFVKQCFEYQYQIMSRKVERELRCVYVCGPAGVGKTHYVKDWCIDHKFSLCVSAAGTHFLEAYKGQDVLLLDDFRASDLKFNDMLKLCDNDTNSEFSARYHNRSLLYCRYLFVTSTVPITDLYFKDDSSKLEELEQLYRRFATRIDMTWDKVTVSTYVWGTCKFGVPIPNVWNDRNKKAITDAAAKLMSDFGVVPQDESMNWVDDDGQEVLPF